MRNPRVLLFAAITVLCTLSAGALWPIPIAFYSFILGAGLSLVGFVLNLQRALREQKYSLTALRDFHDRREAAEIEVPDVAEDAGALCMCCGQTYPSHLRACPHCQTRK